MGLFDDSKDICNQLKAHIGHDVEITHCEETGEIAMECETCCLELLSFFPYNKDELYPTSDLMAEMLGAVQYKGALI